MQIPADALGFAVVIGTLLGTAFGVKFLVWGKKPLRPLRGGDDATAERLQELEDQVQYLSALAADQHKMLDDHQERLDFTERMLTRVREPSES